MTDAIRYEWVRIRTIRSTYWLSVIALVFGVGLSFAGLDGHRTSRSGRTSRPSVSDLDGLGPRLTTQFAVFGVPYFVAYLLAMVSVSSRGGTSTGTGWCARP